MRLSGLFDVTGMASGRALVLPGPLSFWGGVDATTGQIIDQSQLSHGVYLANRVLVMPSGRGSSSSSSVVAEVIRNGCGPAAIVMQRPDPIIIAGALVARSLYNIICPVLSCDISMMRSDMMISISESSSGYAEIHIE